MNIDLSVPIWTIEHVAAALHLSVDAAREYTYLKAFPAAKHGFARNLWLREEVLAWFAQLPGRTADSADGLAAKTATTASKSPTRTPRVASSPAPSSSAPAASAGSRPVKAYRPRREA